MKNIFSVVFFKLGFTSDEHLAGFVHLKISILCSH